MPRSISLSLTNCFWRQPMNESSLRNAVAAPLSKTPSLGSVPLKTLPPSRRPSPPALKTSYPRKGIDTGAISATRTTMHGCTRISFVFLSCFMSSWRDTSLILIGLWNGSCLIALRFLGDLLLSHRAEWSQATHNLAGKNYTRWQMIKRATSLTCLMN